MANGNLLYVLGNSNRGSLYQRTGVEWGGRWEGGSKSHVYLWLIHVEV